MNENENLMEVMAGFAEMFFKENGNISPMFTIFGGDGQTIIPVLALWTNDAEKEAVSDAVVKLIEKHNAIRVGFMVEAWLVLGQDDPNIDIDSSPSQHPKRREAIFLTVEDMFGKALSGYLEIIRDDAGKGSLKKIELMPADAKSEGKFSHLFKKTESLH